MTQGRSEELSTGQRVGSGKTVLILTSNYPYHPGEQFLETEMLSWAKNFDGRVVLMPKQMRGRPRNLPVGITLSSALSDSHQSYFDRFKALVASVGHRLFCRELVLLHQRRKLSLKTVINALKAVTQVNLTRMVLQREAIRRFHPDLIYTYWFAYGTYAAVSSGLGSRVVTRVHGGDLYEDRSPDGHLYLRQQFADRIDRIYAISEDGVRHLRETTGADHNVKLSRLGVRVPPSSSQPSAEGCVSILSVSFCVPVKNIDRIIRGIKILAERHPDWNIVWHHIGDGPLRQSLEQKASEEFSSTGVDWTFCGHMENADVLHFIESRPIDLFINASASEGLPVSIMEAMARGVPAVAPDVGGVSEIVSSETGIILPADASEQEIAGAISDGIGHLKSPTVRARAKQTVVSKFNADANYKAFIEEIVIPSIPANENGAR